MADNLRRLTNSSSFSVLQDKLDNWYKGYHIVSCDQSLNKCCELIELTAKIQGELFTILNLTAAEGGHFAGVDTIKSRLLPWLGTCFSMAGQTVTDHTSFQLIQDSAEKDRRIKELSSSHDSEMQKMNCELNSTCQQLDSARAELVGAQRELNDAKSRSTTTLLATEDEILQLKAELQSAQEQEEMFKRKQDDSERQIRLLKDEVSFLNKEKTMLHERLARSRSPSPLPRLSRSTSPRRNESPTRAQLTNSTRRVRLISRFNDLYSVERLEAQSLLRRYISDPDMVQKIIFIAAVESFNAAKLAYRQFKLRVRKTLSPTHFGPESLEDTAVDYIVRNLDLYDVQASINYVISAMNVNPRISFPPEVDFSIISAFIREICKVAFAMQTLDIPLDLARATNGEIFNKSKYRRSYDSDFSTPLVNHHVWPALMEGDAVVVKGEAVTRRDALWNRSRSRSASPPRSRSLSPGRSLAFSGKRSLSPERLSASHL